MTNPQQKQVTIYSTPTCTYCKHTKDFFKEHGITYTEYDVAADATRRAEMIEKSGQLGVPVTVIDNDVIIGFDQESMSELLGIAV